MVHGTDIKVYYVIKVDKELNKYRDIYPLCSKLKYDVSQFNKNEINMNFKINYERCNFPKGLFYGIDYDIDSSYNSSVVYYNSENGLKELKERNIELETVKKYADVLFYITKIKKLSKEEIEEIIKMEIPLDIEKGIEIREYYGIKLRRIMEREGYLEEIKRLGEELTSKIELTENEKKILEEIKKELNANGINVISEEYKISLEFY